MISCTCLFGSELKCTFHWNTQPDIFAKSPFKLIVIESMSLRTEKWAQQKNSSDFDVRLSNKSLMYIKKSSGSGIEPWGTLASTCVHGEFWPYKTTLFFLLFEKSIRVLEKLPDIPFSFSLKRNTSCQTLPNVFEISRNTPLTSWPSSNNLYICHRWCILVD